MDKNEILRRCTRFLPGHYIHRRPLKEVYTELLSNIPEHTYADVYGEGSLITSFENEIAGLLGKESAVFMPSGTMAQQIALRIWSQRKGLFNVAFHPRCHLEIEEYKAYEVLHGLHGICIGSPYQLMTTEDLNRTNQSLSTLLIELPQREIGGQLPSWEELNQITAWGRNRNVAMHLDGARLWECKAFYQKEYSDITSLFDSVYVSFYKGIGGNTGAMLAGPADFIAEAKIWQRRHGGNLVRMYPFILAAQQGLKKRLPQMQTFYTKAVEVAETLSCIKGIEVMPSLPQVNMMHIFIKGEKEKIERAALEIAADTGVWLLNSADMSQINSYCKSELYIGDAASDISNEEIHLLFSQLINKIS